MTTVDGRSSLVGTKARFFPLHPDTAIQLLIQPAQGGRKGRRNRIIRPEGAAPFIRTPLRIKNFGPIFGMLIGSEMPIPEQAVTVDWPAQIWRVEGWWYDSFLIRTETDISAEVNASSNPALVLKRVRTDGKRPKATHGAPQCREGRIVFPTATFGR